MWLASPSCVVYPQGALLPCVCAGIGSMVAGSLRDSVSWLVMLEGGMYTQVGTPGQGGGRREGAGGGGGGVCPPSTPRPIPAPRHQAPVGAVTALADALTHKHHRHRRHSSSSLRAERRGSAAAPNPAPAPQPSPRDQAAAPTPTSSARVYASLQDAARARVATLAGYPGTQRLSWHAACERALQRLLHQQGVLGACPPPPLPQ
jgi:hypothetical protein